LKTKLSNSKVNSLSSSFVGHTDILYEVFVYNSQNYYEYKLLKFSFWQTCEVQETSYYYKLLPSASEVCCAIPVCFAGLVKTTPGTASRRFVPMNSTSSSHTLSCAILACAVSILKQKALEEVMAKAGHKDLLQYQHLWHSSQQISKLCCSVVISQAEDILLNLYSVLERYGCEKSLEVTVQSSTIVNQEFEMFDVSGSTGNEPATIFYP
jgi:hypothetical protein